MFAKRLKWYPKVVDGGNVALILHARREGDATQATARVQVVALHLWGQGHRSSVSPSFIFNTYLLLFYLYSTLAIHNN